MQSINPTNKQNSILESFLIIITYSVVVFLNKWSIGGPSNYLYGKLVLVYLGN